MKKVLLSTIVAGCVIFFTTKNVTAQITENFDDITLLAGNGWSLQNLSTPVGSTNWFQGTNIAAGGPFDSYNGAANSYIGANYNNTGNTGTISNWLMTPNVTLRNGDVFTFYTRKVAPDTYADRLEVRMSTNGASTNAGTNATTVGDFTTVLLSINPSLVLGIYPTVWTQYTITISGLSAPTSGRLAFRYFVTGAGLSGTNSDYIGIDAFQYTPYVCPTLTISPSSLPNGTAGTAYSQNLSQTGALGSPSYSVTAGALPPGLTMSAAGVISGTPTATGPFSFTATVGDASGCTGSQAYTITIDCPINGASLSSIPAQCSNGSPYTLTQGSPAGGAYSGTGVTAGQFDPSAGTQTITYTLTDAYGCIQSTNSSITVNTAPTVTLSTLTAVCSDAAPFTLAGGSPAGGLYSGTGVSGGQFDPSVGTQTVTYSYTDANGCSNSDAQVQTVNTIPTVTLSSFTPACTYSGLITLSGGSPAGGIYSGTGVSAGQFDVSAGTQTVTYTYVDANGCTNSDNQVYTVNAQPTVGLSAADNNPCVNYAAFTLTGTPSGGTYFGTGVSGSTFNPTTAGVGTHIVSYTYTDVATGCADTATSTIIVSGCAGIENNLNSMLSIFPNPADEIISVQLSSITANQNWKFEITTLEGKTLFAKEVFVSSTGYTEVIDISLFSAGAYLIKITNSVGEAKIDKFIKR